MPHRDGTLRGKAEKVFRLLSYDVWRRELKKFRRRDGAQPLRIVDIGCGPGFLLSCLHRWFPGADLIGIDASEELLAVAKSRCNAMRTLKGDASSLPLGDGSADVVFALHVVEHLANPADLFKETCRILRPGGLLIMATPNAEGLGSKLMKQNWQGYSDPTHISLNGPPYWRELLSSTGFDIVKDGTTGLSGIPLFNRMPIGLIHWIPSFFCGYYHWRLGEAYVCAAIRRLK